MDSSEKHLDSFSSHSSAEIQFLQQVKECQYNLNCMEKLFFDSIKEPGYEKQQKKSCTSLNSKLSKSYPDLQLLMQEYETKINSKCDTFKASESIKSSKEIYTKSQDDLMSKNEPSAPLTFVIQVPNTLLNSLKKKIPCDSFTNISSQVSTKQGFKSQKKSGIFFLLQKLFKRKKRDAPTVANIKISQDLLQFLRPKSKDSSTNTQDDFDTNIYNCESMIKNDMMDKNFLTEKSNNIELKCKSNNFSESSSLIFPITYNFDGKSCAMPNLNIQHEIIPQSNSNTYSHSIKIKNELPVESSNKIVESTKKEGEIEEIKEKDNVHNTRFETTEIFMNTLIQTLLKITERLNDLESIKVLVEKLNKEELKTEKSNEVTKNSKTKHVIKSKFFGQLLHTKTSTDTKIHENPSSKENVQQIPSRQLSKLSIWSSSNSFSSDDEFHKSSIINSRLHHIQKHPRCQSPSTLNYLVCQSERDTDYKLDHH